MLIDSMAFLEGRRKSCSGASRNEWVSVSAMNELWRKSRSAWTSPFVVIAPKLARTILGTRLVSVFSVILSLEATYPVGRLWMMAISVAPQAWPLENILFHSHSSYCKALDTPPGQQTPVRKREKLEGENHRYWAVRGTYHRLEYILQRRLPYPRPRSRGHRTRPV